MCAAEVHTTGRCCVADCWARRGRRTGAGYSTGSGGGAEQAALALRQQHCRYLTAAVCLQELEKFKFVLDYKIKELKKQIEPREAEIAEMKEQVRRPSLLLPGYRSACTPPANDLCMTKYGLASARSAGTHLPTSHHTDVWPPCSHCFSLFPVPVSPQIKEMDGELERYHKTNSALDLTISNMRLKQAGLSNEVRAGPGAEAIPARRHVRSSIPVSLAPHPGLRQLPLTPRHTALASVGVPAYRTGAHVHSAHRSSPCVPMLLSSPMTCAVALPSALDCDHDITPTFILCSMPRLMPFPHVPRQVADQRRDKQDAHALLRRFQHDLQEVAGFMQEPKVLKEKVSGGSRPACG